MRVSLTAMHVEIPGQRQKKYSKEHDKKTLFSVITRASISCNMVFLAPLRPAMAIISPGLPSQSTLVIDSTSTTDSTDDLTA